MKLSRRTSEADDGSAPDPPVYPVTTMLALDAIVPYWRNPRVIPDNAVNAVIESIREFGYQQPIVVDSANVIIIGHTRYAALRRMGETEVPVIVSDMPAAKAKELRVLDNKLQEFTSWQHDDLMAELSELDQELMRSYFPEVGGFTDPGPTVAQEQAAVDVAEWDKVDPLAEFVCPSCYHTFEITVTRDAVATGKLEVSA